MIYEPEVSVVIPTCNRPDLMMRSITSVLLQTFTNLEVIVVVDGADEATARKLAAVDDRRLGSILLENNVGAAEARNVGARAARGRWIALLDDDDEWLPEKLERQLAIARNSDNPDLIVTSKYLCRIPGKPDTVRPRRLPKPGEPITEYMFDYLCYFQTSTFLCSRELFLRIPFPSGLKSFQDIDWFLRVNREPSVQLAIAPEPLVVYHSPEERSTITSKLHWKRRLEWGKANRHLMTRAAYSNFIAGSCAGRAAQDGAGLNGFLELFRECAWVGSPSIANLMLLSGTFLVTPALRRRIRDLVFLSRSKSRAPQPNFPAAVATEDSRVA